MAVLPFFCTKGAETDTSFEICIDVTHPALSGHFPGNPIVPGALLLSEIGTRLATVGIIITGIRKVRFMQPVQPADPVVVDCHPGANGQLRFECRVTDTVVARGSFVVKAITEHD